MKKLSKTKKALIGFITFLLSVPIGGALGFIIGLLSINFIPMCCNDNGCHNCFEFNGLIGYEATAMLGFWIGLFLIPIISLSLIIYFISKK